MDLEINRWSKLKYKHTKPQNTFQTLYNAVFRINNDVKYNLDDINEGNLDPETEDREKIQIRIIKERLIDNRQYKDVTELHFKLPEYIK